MWTKLRLVPDVYNWMYYLISLPEDSGEKQPSKTDTYVPPVPRYQSYICNILLGTNSSATFTLTHLKSRHHIKSIMGMLSAVYSFPARICFCSRWHFESKLYKFIQNDNACFHHTPPLGHPNAHNGYAVKYAKHKRTGQKASGPRHASYKCL